MNTVHIFYNGNDFEAPEAQQDRWSNYSNENSPRLFLACCASWEKHGWNVRRVTTTQFVPTQGFEFKGVLRRDLYRYPLTHWNVWFEWLALCEHDESILVCNMDVFNYGLWYPQFCDAKAPMSLHTNGWTASIGYVNREFCRNVIETIKGVDAGHLEAPQCELYTDDAIVNKYFSPARLFPALCTFAYIRVDWKTFPLIQFPRSTIRRCLEHIRL